MAKQRYYLDTRVLTAFFFAAMPFVAFGSFIVVNQAKNQLRESVGASLEQRAVQTKLALEQYVGEQVVQLRVLALDPDVQQALAAPARPVPEADAAPDRAGLGLRQGREAQRLAPRVAARGAAQAARRSSAPRSSRSRSSTRTGRVVAASSRGGRLFYGESAWFKDLAAQEGEPEVHVGELYRAAGSTVNLLEIAFPVRNRDDVWLGAVRALLDASDLYTVLAPVRIGRTGHASLIRATDGLVLASDESERILKMPLPGLRLAAQRGGGLPPGRVRPGRSSAARARAAATGRSPR